MEIEIDFTEKEKTLGIQVAKSFLTQEDNLIQGIEYGQVGTRVIKVLPRNDVDFELDDYLLGITCLTIGFQALDDDPNFETRLRYSHVEEKTKNHEFHFVFEERM